jgi:hypothetical protein
MGEWMDHGSGRGRYRAQKWFMRFSGWWAMATIPALMIASRQLVHAQAANADSYSTVLYPGAIEAGIGGSLVVVSGITNASIGLRGGSFVAVPAGLAGYELDLAYTHISLLDRVDIEGRFCWSLALHGSSTLPFLGIGGGMRQEWMGTFSQTRYPIGGGVGMRTLFGTDVAIRSEYIYRYVAGDPVANYSEHKLEFGLSLLLNNSSDSQSGDEQ